MPSPVRAFNTRFQPRHNNIIIFEIAALMKFLLATIL